MCGLPSVRARSLAVLLVVPALASRSSFAATDVAAAVVVVDALPPSGAVEAAREQVPGNWRLEVLKPEVAPPRAPQPEVQDLARAYLNADFLRCLTELQRASLDLDRMLEHGRRAEAAQVWTFAAACALGAGDEARARELVRRLLARELDDPDTFHRTTPQFQRLTEEERANAQRLGRVIVEMRTDPEGASVQVDGAPRCQATPCRVHLLRGEHVVVSEKLGWRARAVSSLLDEDQNLTIALDPAPADEARRQIAAALGAGVDPSGVDIARAASTAFGVGLLVLVWPRGQEVHATVFQRAGGGLTHVTIDAGANATPRAVRTALREWHADTGPRSMLRQPLFWTTAVGVAVVSAAAVFFVYRPMETRHDIVFPQ